MIRFLFKLTSVFILASGSIAQAQDFTATGPTNNVANNIIYPLKAGSSIQLQVKLKSNRKDTCTVSLDKNSMGYVGDWITIDNNSQKIFPNQEVTFQFTVKPPTGTLDNEYPLWLAFNAYDKYNNNHPFSYNILTIIVDNTPPDVPTVRVEGKTSKSISISFNSFDFRSAHYTANAPTSGIGGIKTYTLTIQNPQGSITSKTANANDISSYYTFGGLSPNTPYAVRVTATDLASNSSTSPAQLATTPPAAPTNLSVSNTTYCSALLTWDASGGATSYTVYDVTTSPRVKIGTVPATSSTVTNLIAGGTTKYYVTAENSFGVSDVSSTVTVTTPSVPVPTLAGPALVCSSSVTFTASEIPSGCSISWEHSLNLSPTVTAGNYATFTPNGNGLGWVTARFASCGGYGLYSPQSTVWVGTPSGITIFGRNGMKRGGIAAYTVKEAAIQCINSYSWDADGGMNPYGSTSSSSFRAKATGCGTGDIYCTVSNACGGAEFGNLTVDIFCETPSYAVSPNPASTELTVSILRTDSQTASRSEISNETIDYVKIYDLNGNLKKTLQCKGSRSATVNVSDLREGTYILEAGNSKFSEKQQILVRK